MGIKPSIEILENILVLKLSGARMLYDVDEINELLIKELQKSKSKKAVIDYTGVKGKRSIVESVQKAESILQRIAKLLLPRNLFLVTAVFV